MRVIQMMVPLTLAGAVALPASAQTDAQSLREINDIDVVSQDGERIGEIEDVLIDETGKPVAVAVDIGRNFLDIGDKDAIFTMDQLSFENGRYVTGLTSAEIEALPRYND